MLPGGVVAGSQACCCENPPPPPPCFCGEYCPYIIEITAPSEVAVRSPPGGCDGGTDFASADDDSWLVWMVAPPGGLGLSVGTMTGYAPQSTNWSAQNNVLVAGLAAGVQVEADYTDGDPWDPTITRVEISVGLSFYCEQEPGGAYATRPVVIAGIDVHIKQWRSGQWAPFLGLSAAGVTKSITFYPPTECQYTNERTCGYSIAGPGPANGRYIQTPLTLDVSGSTTSQGAWGQSGSATVGSLGTTLLGWADDIVDAISATFRITSRDNCEPPVACNCDASLGGMRVLLGNLKSYSVNPEYYEVGSSLVDFVYLDFDQTVSWQGPFGFYEYTQLDRDGPTDGDGKCTRRLWYQRAELYCDVIDGVAQWFVLFTSFRDIYDEDGASTHRSYDEWAGKIDCFEACEDLDNFIDEDEPVPMGEPYDIEYLGRTTETGYLECEPPPRLTIRLTQIQLC